MHEKTKVLVAMSGGVDSSVAAALLLEQGFEVIGLTIATHKLDDDCRPVENKKSCCSYTGSLDAYRVCQILGIEHKIIDLTETFKNTVIDNFIAEYLHGRTPNPCVECNIKIKWGPFLTKANEYGADYLATGHYAKVLKNENNGRFYISKGIDKSKDQSYALWGLSQEQLAKTIFPLAEYTKQEVREIARKYDLPVFNKIESQDICFIPNNNYHSFIEKQVPDINQKVNNGNIIFRGKIIGKHKGFPFYTVGQRKGLGISFSEPLYVKKINAGNNIIEVDTFDETYNNGLIGEKLNLMKYNELDATKVFSVKIRYNDKGKSAYCRINSDGLLQVDFIEKRRSVAPGQSVVIYEGDDVVGGALIKEAL
ncbi:MAG: tRNA 2-thiouridine(34) synthase MnmA [Ignavibacteria bacterium]|nr:tRNA 2-thiouridine(34) synthase MnmA [Ignavibacteria bacterium]